MGSRLLVLQIAGGTGITPMLQVVDAIMSNPSDNTQVQKLCPLLSMIPLMRMLRFLPPH